MELSFFPKDFNFQKIFSSGLFYFFYEKEPVRVVYFQGRLLTLSFSQNKSRLIVKIKGEPKDLGLLSERIEQCLGLNENLHGFYTLCKKDPVLNLHLEKIRGSRIISAFSGFEALVGAIVSQNNSYMNYRKKMLEIYQSLNFLPKNFTQESLKDMKLGYKVPFLVALADDFGKKEPRGIKGIGPYSLQLFEIFQKRNYSAFYMDCLTEKIMREQYGITSGFEKASLELWGKWRGLAEAYLQRFFEVK